LISEMMWPYEERYLRLRLN